MRHGSNADEQRLQVGDNIILRLQAVKLCIENNKVNYFSALPEKEKCLAELGHLIEVLEGFNVPFVMNFFLGEVDVFFTNHNEQSNADKLQEQTFKCDQKILDAALDKKTEKNPFAIVCDSKGCVLGTGDIQNNKKMILRNLKDARSKQMELAIQAKLAGQHWAAYVAPLIAVNDTIRSTASIQKLH